jgi:hypothetical protein
MALFFISMFPFLHIRNVGQSLYLAAKRTKICLAHIGAGKFLQQQARLPGNDSVPPHLKRELEGFKI